ncbi:MAG TPA: DUF5606 domain-containing protein [Saprospiraceae bacterium]|nr:DUF5606 domain-containing protein [Saprospiraceae bacterium]
MNLANVIAISGMPGLFELVTTRNNGLVASDLETGKSNFYSIRKHQFTPLETVAIYTYDDTEELKKIFSKMLEEEKSGNLPVDIKSDNLVLMEYFESILPKYDDDRVFPKDVKKIIKWFFQLKYHGYFAADTTGKSEEE